MKDLEYYLSLPYTRELIPEPDGTWLIRIKELPNCISYGISPEEALANINDAMRGWLEVEIEDKTPIPEPVGEIEYSGRFNQRLPKSLHRKLAEEAEQEGLSMNSFISTLLAEAIGERKDLIHTEASNESIQDFNNNLSKICPAIDPNNLRGSTSYERFSSWIKDKLDIVSASIQNNSEIIAFSELRGMVSLLEPHNNNPIMESIVELLNFTQKSLSLLGRPQTEQSAIKLRVVIGNEKLRQRINTKDFNLFQGLNDSWDFNKEKNGSNP